MFEASVEVRGGLHLLRCGAVRQAEEPTARQLCHSRTAAAREKGKEETVAGGDCCVCAVLCCAVLCSAVHLDLLDVVVVNVGLARGTREQRRERGAGQRCLALSWPAVCLSSAAFRVCGCVCT